LPVAQSPLIPYEEAPSGASAKKHTRVTATRKGVPRQHRWGIRCPCKEGTISAALAEYLPEGQRSNPRRLFLQRPSQT
jgi:hypothetical protein